MQDSANTYTFDWIHQLEHAGDHLYEGLIWKIKRHEKYFP